ncbi:MAG: hypothetical protein WC683_06690 [bacterium]
MAYDVALQDDHGTGSFDDLAKKTFLSNVVRAFVRSLRAADFVSMAPISGKTSEDYIRIVPEVTPEIHDPNAEIAGQTLEKTVGTVRIEDKETIAAVYLSKRDALISHYDEKGETAFACGYSLAKQVDEHVLRQLIVAAQTSASGNFKGGQSVSETGTFATIFGITTPSVTASKLLQTAIQKLDLQFYQDDVPENEQKVIFCRPDIKLALRQDDTLMSRDFTSPMFANKELGTLTMVEGHPVIPTNAFPRSSFTAVTTGPTKQGTYVYIPDASKVAMVVASRQALKGVMAEGVTVTIDWIPVRRSWLCTAAIMKGLDTYRPECAGIVVSSA